MLICDSSFYILWRLSSVIAVRFQWISFFNLLQRALGASVLYFSFFPPTICPYIILWSSGRNVSADMATIWIDGGLPWSSSKTVGDTVGVSQTCLKALQYNASENSPDSSLSTLRLTEDVAFASMHAWENYHKWCAVCAKKLNISKDMSWLTFRSKLRGLLPDECACNTSPGSC